MSPSLRRAPPVLGRQPRRPRPRTSGSSSRSVRPPPPPPNAAPAAKDVTANATSGVAQTITLTGTDPETCELTFERPATALVSGATVSGPSPETCSGSNPHTDTATVTYRAPVDFSGPDSFTYTVSDGTNTSATATVSITVSPPPNTAPTAQDVTVDAIAGVATTITLRGSDAETCELTLDRPATTLTSGATASGPSPETCSGSDPHLDTATVTYRAPVDFSGPDSFTYTVDDGRERSTAASVSVSVAV